MDFSLPETLEHLLAGLRGRIRRYLFLQGLAILIAVVGLLFWVSLSVDSAWFAITRLELPRTTRLIILVASCVLLGVVLFQQLVWKLVVRLRRRALALLLERKFPELNDRLITLVETVEETEGGKPADRPVLSARMLARTFEETGELTRDLPLERIFNPQPLRRSLLLAFVAVISIGATAAASPSTVSRWSEAYLKLAETYWNRINGLDLYVLAQPGDRLREFTDGVYKHAAGADLTIIVETAEGKQRPDQVVLAYRLGNGVRGRAVMTPAGSDRFRHTIGNLVDDLEFTITGGDFTTLRPRRVLTVPEPQIATVVADCVYPEYTGWNAVDLGEPTQRTLSAAELTVPMETQLTLQMQSTKPLVAARIVGRNFELEIRRGEADASPTAEYRTLDELGVVQSQQSLSTATPILESESGWLHVPFLITLPAEAAGAARVGDPSPAADSENEPPPAVVSPTTSPAEAVTIVTGDSLRIYLEDTDGIINLEPTRLDLIGQPDQPPIVNTRLFGIGRAVTRKAVLPFIGTVTDDYGIAELAFEYQLGEAAELTQQLLERQPAGTSLFEMVRPDEITGSQPADPAQQPARFDLLPLDAETGDLLVIALVATDTDDLNGPHQARGERYRLKVVSDEELLSLLYQDELNLRRRFEQVIAELERSRDDLAESLADAENPSRLPEAVQRSLNVIQKDAVECDAIRAAFASILEELINNRIDTPQMRTRLSSKIIEPLGRVLETEFDGTEERLREVDFQLRTGTRDSAAAQACLAEMDQLLSSLAQILLEMRKLESFQEVIELLKGIIADEKALKEKTEQERKKKLIDLLN